MGSSVNQLPTMGRTLLNLVLKFEVLSHQGDNVVVQLKKKKGIILNYFKFLSLKLSL